MAQLNITLDQEKTLLLLLADRGDAFKKHLADQSKQDPANFSFGSNSKAASQLISIINASPPFIRRP